MMMMNEQTEKIQAALTELGYKNANFRNLEITPDRHFVWINEEYFGVWDSIKQTFVD